MENEESSTFNKFAKWFNKTNIIVLFIVLILLYVFTGSIGLPSRIDCIYGLKGIIYTSINYLLLLNVFVSFFVFIVNLNYSIRSKKWNLISLFITIFTVELFLSGFILLIQSIFGMTLQGCNIPIPQIPVN